MSKNVKTILIVVGILVAIPVVCFAGFLIIGKSLGTSEFAAKHLEAGREFGRTNDNAGCQTKMVEMLKPVKDTDINELMKVQYHFDGCLETSRATPDFCAGAVNPYGDIFNDDKGKDAECERIGMKGSIPCRLVIDKKLDFCMSKK